MQLLGYGRITPEPLDGNSRPAAEAPTPKGVPKVAALGAIALALDETDWLPVKRPRK
jgi:hypothetical protein